MWKETIICIIIIISIFIGNYVTKNYMIQSIEEINPELLDLKEELNKDENEVDYERVKKDADNIFSKWNDKHKKLAYFIEHDELEKVQTNLVSLKSLIEVKSYEQSITELDKTVFSLNHLQDKFEFSLENIF